MIGLGVPTPDDTDDERTPSRQPAVFIAGRKFELEVKRDFTARGDAKTEYRLVDTNKRSGRADIWVVFDRSSSGDPVATAIFEIKSTLWDGVSASRIRPNILRTARQLWRYIDTAMDSEHQAAQAYVVFPEIPSDAYVRRVIELLLAERGIVTYWWTAQETTPYEFMDAATEGGADLLSLLNILAPQFLSVEGVIPKQPPWVLAALGAGRNTRAAMGRIVWENL